MTTLSTDDRLRLCQYASNLRLSPAVCYDPTKFYLKILPNESAAEHNARLTEYREALVSKFTALQQKIRARYTYRHHTRG